MITWTSVALGGTTGWIWRGSSPTSDRDFWLTNGCSTGCFPGNDVPTTRVAGADPRVLARPGLPRHAAVRVPRAHAPARRDRPGHARRLALRGARARGRDARRRRVAPPCRPRTPSLRRLERDIHDGPQQRLVRMQMDLAAVDRQLAQDPDSAKALVGEAREQASEALDELRALSRGFAPPILQDRGLAAGLESLASRSPVPVIVEVDLADAALPAPIERNAYFIAAELLTNAGEARGGDRHPPARRHPRRRHGRAAGSTSGSPTTVTAARRPRPVTGSPASTSGCAASGAARDRQPRRWPDHDRRAPAVRAARSIRNRAGS